MTELLNAIATPLKQLFRTTRPVYVGSCSATGFMEMAVRSGVRHRCLSLVGGAFGERFAGIAAASGREVVRLDVPLGKTVEPDILRDAIRRSDVDAVTLVHSETSTGALAPLEELAKVVDEFDDVMLLVDAVTSLAGSPVETDAWKLDFVLTGSQKALALPPGLALAAASERMLARAKTVPERGAYFDMVAYDEAFVSAQPTNTPAVSLFFALQRQLERIAAEGGVEAAGNGTRPCAVPPSNGWPMRAPGTGFPMCPPRAAARGRCPASSCPRARRRRRSPRPSSSRGGPSGRDTEAQGQLYPHRPHGRPHRRRDHRAARPARPDPGLKYVVAVADP